MTTDSNASSTELPSIHIASASRRLLALLYDALLILALIFFCGIILVFAGTKWLTVASISPQLLPAWYRFGVMLPTLVLVTSGFYAVFWRVSGQTLGMQTWKIKTVDRQGRLLSWRLSFIRCAAALIVPMACVLLSALRFHHIPAFIFSFCVGFLFNYFLVYFHPRSLAFHDWLSGTLTVNLTK